MKNSLETRLGIFFALVFVAAFVLFEMVGGGRLFDSGIPIKARFNSAGDLKVGDPVKLAGVDIGRVQTIRIADGKVEVSMTVEPAAGVRTDSKASIKFTGMMGQNFMAIDFGSPASPVASTGALLESREQPDLAAIMSKLESAADGMQNMTKSFSGEEFTKLLGPMTDMIKDNQPRIASILSNLDSVTTGIALHAFGFASSTAGVERVAGVGRIDPFAGYNRVLVLFLQAGPGVVAPGSKGHGGQLAVY